MKWRFTILAGFSLVSLTDALYGAIVGLALGLTGGGGSIVTLPILVYLVGETVHEAIGTSLAVVAGIAAQGLIGQRTRVAWKTGFALGALGLAGSVPASLLSQRVPGTTLLLAFSVVMIVAAVAMLRVSRPAEAGGTPRPYVVVAVGVGLGALTGFLGVGGGFLIVPALTLALGFPMHRAIPTSLLVIALNSIVSLVTRTAVVGIDWGVVALFLAGGIAGNLVGAVGARRLDQRRLKQIFAFFVITVGIFTGASALGLIPFRVR